MKYFIRTAISVVTLVVVLLGIVLCVAGAASGLIERQ